MMGWAAGSPQVTVTYVVSDRAMATADTLVCADDDYDTVTIASPHGVTQLVLAGTRHDLRRALHAGLTALGDDTAS